MNLNAEIRSAVLVAAINFRFEKDFQQLAADKAALADAIYNTVLSESDRAKIRRLPKGWLHEASSIAVRFGGDYTRVYFKDAKGDSAKRRIPDFMDRSAVFLDVHAPLTLRFRELEKREHELKALREDAEMKIKAILKRARTLKQLHEIWPESERFTKGIVKTEGKVGLPMVPIKELNQLLGLAK